MKVIDFEVFKHNWLCVVLDPVNHTMRAIVDNRYELLALYQANKDDVWIGFNIRGYDQWVFKAILCGENPYALSTAIINGGSVSYRRYSRYPLYFYDVKTTLHGLKTLEGFMGHDIQESDVDFDLDRPLTQEELMQTIEYCKHDVEQTYLVFLHRFEEFQTQLELCKEFKLDKTALGKTQTQLAAIALGATKCTLPKDEFNFKAPANLRLTQNADIVQWFYINRDYNASLTRVIGGVEHVFGWGGLHGAIPCYHDRGRFINVDVALTC